MKKPMYLILLWAGCVLSDCNPDKESTSKASEARSEAAKPATRSTPAAPAGGGMAGMPHSAPPATASAQLAAMNRMMAAMDRLPAQGNTDYDFAQMMRAHHRGAVEMAALELRDGQDPAMRQLAATIRQDQQQELGVLTSALARLGAAPANYQPQKAADPFTRAMKASMDDMMSALPAPTTAPDLDFNQLMIKHHQSAVVMARAELASGTDRQLRDLARQIIRTQQREIEQLTLWQSRRTAPAR